MKIIDRVFQYLDYKRVKPTRFEKNIGLSNGYLGLQYRRKADLGEGIIIKIIENCRDMSPIWLILGKGEMLLGSSVEELEVPYKKTCRGCIDKERIIEGLEKTILLLEEKTEGQKKKIESLEKGSVDKKSNYSQTA